MKILILLSLVVVATSCNKKPTEDPAKTVINPGASAIDQVTEDESSIVEENDMCICTKEYMPVCGSNGQTYPSACQAGCDGVTEYTDGSCS